MSYVYNPFTKNLDYFLVGFYRDTFWDDLRFPFVGQRVDISAGRIDYDFAEVGVGFQDNTRYPEEVICILAQLPHKWKQETNIKPHIHYIQNQNATPNWLLEYRVYENNTVVPSSFTKSTGSDLFTYPGSGSILQIHVFPEIDMTGIDSVSALIDFKFYRDTANTSTEFSGSDPYSGTALSKEFDLHFEIDRPGSREEYTK